MGSKLPSVPDQKLKLGSPHPHHIQLCIPNQLGHHAGHLWFIVGNDTSSKGHHRIAVLTNQHDGGWGTEHSTNQKYENQQPVEQHEKSKKAKLDNKEKQILTVCGHTEWTASKWERLSWHRVVINIALYTALTVTLLPLEERWNIL